MRASTLVILAIFLTLSTFAEEKQEAFSQKMASLLRTEIALQSSLLARYESELRELEKIKFVFDKQSKVAFLEQYIAHLKESIAASKTALITQKNPLKKGTDPWVGNTEGDWADHSRQANRSLLYSGFIEYCLHADKFSVRIREPLRTTVRSAAAYSSTLNRVGKNMKGAIDGNSRAREEILEHVQVKSKLNPHRSE